MPPNPSRFQLKIHKRNYTATQWIRLIEEEDQPSKMICPYEERLIHGDIIEIDNNNNDINQNSKPTYRIVEPSPYRSSIQIPGLLQLSTGKTFGREGKKQLVKCIPNDRHLPIFLVPYEDKHPGFYKNKVDKYVTFSMNEWTTTEKHPRGMIRSMIGSVDDYSNFCEYQMICRGLHDSIRPISIKAQTFLKQLSTAATAATATAADTANNKYDHNTQRLIQQITTKHHDRIDPSDIQPNVYTIDPEGCVDNDDAFSVRRLPASSTKEEDSVIELTVYIADVALMMDEMDLWDEFADRVATVYLPPDTRKHIDEDGGKRPMLPPFLSDNVFSLRPGKPRLAIAYQYLIHEETGEIIDTKTSTKLIRVTRQFSYEESLLIENPDYQLARQVVEKMNRLSSTFFIEDNKPMDSHEFVAFLMILVNHCTAQRIIERCANDQDQDRDQVHGILRSGYSAVLSQSTSENEIDKLIETSLPEGVARFIHAWENGGSGSKYVVATTAATAEYCHITSPIRRLVDLLNQIATHPLVDRLSAKSKTFLKRWYKRIDYINDQMRQIKRIQNDCQIFHTFFMGHQNQLQTQESHKLYKAYVIGEDSDLTDSEYISCYLVYVPELKLMTKMKMILPEPPEKRCPKKHDEILISIYAFFDEDRMSRKIRTQFKSFVTTNEPLLSYINDKLQI